MNIQSKTITLPYVNDGKETTIFYESDRFIREVLIGQEYEKYIDFLPKHGLRVMDLGCNIGTFSLSVYDRSEVIYSIDLSINCIELLKKTIEVNKFTKIVPIQQVISGKNGRVIVSSLEDTDGGNAIRPSGIEVNAITLAQLWKEQHIQEIDLLKIDVEGAEYQIFGAEDFDSIKDKIKVIVGEYHGDVPRLNGFTIQDLPGRHFIAINSLYKDYGNNRASD